MSSFLFAREREKKPRLLLTGLPEVGYARRNKAADYKSRMCLMVEGKLWGRCTKEEPAWHIYPAPVFQKNKHLHGASPHFSNPDGMFIAPVHAVLCAGDKFISNYHTSGNRQQCSYLVLLHLQG
jgi:hypothetical protein